MITQLKSLQERREREGEEGFTLIELLIVIVVLGILAAVVVFALGSVTGNAKASSCNADAKTVEVAVTTYDAYPPNPCGGAGQMACTIGLEQDGVAAGDITPGNTTADEATFSGGTFATDLVNNSDLNTWPGTSNGYAISLSDQNTVAGTPPVTTPDTYLDALTNTQVAPGAGKAILWIGTTPGQIYDDEVNTTGNLTGCNTL
jgi:prepilin-type N-terminal cleavage/methylation domain-containing protein